MAAHASRRSLLIVGAGTAGLSAGCAAARSGYRTTILEMGATPGGLCTSWSRKGYRFSGSVAGLAGTSPDMPIYRLWQELGVVDYCPLYDPEDFGTVVSPEGRSFTVFTDIGRLEALLREEFPSETAAVKEFTAALRSSSRLQMPFRSRPGWAGARELLGSAPASARSLPLLLKYGRLTLRRFIDRLEDPFCRQVFGNLVHFGGPDVPLLTVLLPLAYAHRRATGVPRHGWLSFARALERRFVELGGEVRYGSRVTGLTRDAGRVTGVELADGTSLAADRVLSAADGRFTRGVLLGEGEEADRLYPADRLSDQPVQVNLGVAAEPNAVQGSMTYLLPEEPEAGGRRQSRVTVHTDQHDPDAAPPGSSAVTAFLESDYGFWRRLQADRGAYEAEKQRCAQLVVDAVERFRPGFAAAVQVIDVSTPLTRERYTGNWRGAMQARKPDASMVKALTQGGPRYGHPQLDGFWMAGQWVESWGGITTAAQSGRAAAMALCRSDGVPFA